jgi:hypothetical protein
MILASSKSVLKTFRFDSDLAAKLSKISRKLGMSENEYVSRRLENSVIMDPLLQNIDGIGVSRILFQEIISQTNFTAFEILASEIVRNNLELAFDSLGLEMTPSSVIRFMQDVLQNLGWFKMETASSVGYFDFKLFHKLNQKWSFFLKSMLLSMFELVHETPEIIVSDKVVKVRFPKERSYAPIDKDELTNMN